MLFRSSSLATSFATSILFLAVPSSGQITPPPQPSGAASAARRSCSEYESTYAQHNSWRQNGWSVRVWLELTRLSLLLQLLVSSALSPERFLERRYSLVRWASLIFFFSLVLVAVDGWSHPEDDRLPCSQNCQYVRSEDYTLVDQG
jgi:hypothetical protein